MNFQTWLFNHGFFKVELQIWIYKIDFSWFSVHFFFQNWSFNVEIPKFFSEIEWPKFNGANFYFENSNLNIHVGKFNFENSLLNIQSWFFKAWQRNSEKLNLEKNYGTIHSLRNNFGFSWKDWIWIDTIQTTLYEQNQFRTFNFEDSMLKIELWTFPFESWILHKFNYEISIRKNNSGTHHFE